MKLHENKELFRQAITATAQKLQLPDVYIEKDYWVTYALHTIYQHEIGKDTIFKGGTALSKCYKMIDRFSEDIDLVMVRYEGETDNQLKKKIKTISQIIKQTLPEVEIEGLTQKMGMNRKTAHTYQKVFDGSYGQVRDVIVLEATWLGYYEPYTTQSIYSLIAEMMLERGQEDMVKEYDLLAFEVQVLAPTRTICEKIMSLVRFSYGLQAIDDLGKKIRHTYDLQQLLSHKELADFFYSADFDAMLLKVAQDDVASYRNDNQWLIHHPSEALIFKDLENVWNTLKIVYQGDFKDLVYGSFPSEQDIFNSLNTIKKRLLDIDWKIQLT